MPLSTDVNLPRNHVARYPDRCVRCEAPSEGKTLRLWTHTVGWWTVVLWIFGRGFSTRVPACHSCSWKIRAQRLGGLLLTIMIAALFLFFVWPYLEGAVAPSLRKWVAMGLILICLAPLFIREVLWPPAICITAFKDSVDYEFRDGDYAEEFAELNEDAEWVKLS